jgi:hypothetical protein
MFRTQGLILFVLLTAGLSAAQTKTLTGLSVVSITPDAKAGTAIVDVMNTSSKDITGFVLSVDDIYTGAKKSHSERTEEYGPHSQPLHPGEVKHVHLWASTLSKTALFITMEVSPIVVVYADQTAEATSDDALTREIEGRKRPMLGYKAAADAIKQALSNQDDQHLMERAVLNLKNQMVEAKTQADVTPGSSGPQPDRHYLSEAMDALNAASTVAAQQKVNEREVIQKIWKENQDKANLYAAYADIRRVQ